MRLLLAYFHFQFNGFKKAQNSTHFSGFSDRDFVSLLKTCDK